MHRVEPPPNVKSVDIGSATTQTRVHHWLTLLVVPSVTRTFWSTEMITFDS